MIPWKDIYEKPDFNYSIMLCILKSNMFSHDHIIVICRGWIFDGNISYTISLNKKSLNWCAGHGELDVVFDGFYQQALIGLKKKTKKTK